VIPARVIRSGRLLFGLLVVSAVTGCGARSALPLCTEIGGRRSCVNECGTGVQVCSDTGWGPCAVSEMSRACSNACGQGVEVCDDGVWSACAVPPATRSCTSVCALGEQRCLDGGWNACDAALPGPPTFSATVRDFHADQPDFEPDSGTGGLTTGIVLPDLGSDDKPVYAGALIGATHGATDFDLWYRDAPPVNMTAPAPIPIPLLPLVATPGAYGYDSDAFFPIDGALFGNEGRLHNFDFTLELAATFRYTGGETFTFASDDDSFVFLNRRLAVDLGGIHQTRRGTVTLDDRSQDLAIVRGRLYPMHLFYAERHLVNAALHIDVTAADFAVCPDGSHP
jgi:fibro-slime domain-containing protein